MSQIKAPVHTIHPAIIVLASLYGQFGPRVTYDNGYRKDVQCQSCGLGYHTAQESAHGVRHRSDCPMRDAEHTLFAAGYDLPHIHPETVALVRTAMPQPAPQEDRA